MKHQCVLIAALLILGNCGTVLLTGCGGGASLNPTLNPTPTITTISPSSALAGGSAFTLTINGTNFVAASLVNFGGTTPVITFVSSTHLTAAIPAAAIASAGNASVTVANPAPGGDTSNAVNFTITGGNNPVPTITGLDPTCAPTGGHDFTLSVNGSNFVTGSVVRWNGSDRPSASDIIVNFLDARIPASDITGTGTATVTVFNPAPGGGSSNTLTLSIVAGGVLPQSIAVDSTGKFAYVANQGCIDAFVGNVSMYTIDSTTGVLTSIGPPVPADLGPHSVTVGPSGKFAYVANDGAGLEGSISTYNINPTTGALTSTGTIPAPCAPPPSPGSCSPTSVAVDPSGKFVYATNEGGFAPTSISMYSANGTTGALTPIDVLSVAGRAVSVAVDPTGKFAYSTNENNSSPAVGNSVSMFTIDTAIGALTSIGTISAGTNPVSVAVDPAGKFAYVANSDSNDVSMYTINTTTGALTSTGTIPAGAQPVSVVVHPTGKFAYVVNSTSNDVSMYTIDTTTGVLTSIGKIAAELSPTSIAIHPSGKFAYVTNSRSNSVTMYTIDTSTGALTFIGTVGT